MKRLKLINRLAVSKRAAAFTLAEGATHVDMHNNTRKVAFTLAEGATHVDMHNNTRKVAFTLAEVMITLAIIGVVAAITMPVLNREITMNSNSTREANIALKITKALENMAVAGDFGNFNSTDEFVDVLQKYLKITKRCSASNLTDCWPTSVITDSDGKKFEVKNAKTGEDLHIKGNTTNNVGLILADGASIILTYNQNFTGFAPDTFYRPIKKTLPTGFAKSKDFVYYRSNVTDPIDFVMDVNGAAPPNREKDSNGNTYDIRSFKDASFSLSASACPEGATKLPDGKCIKIVDSYEPINCENPLIDSEFKSYCLGSKAVDYMSASIKACDDIDMNALEYDQTYFKYLTEAGIISGKINQSTQNAIISGAYAPGGGNGKVWCYNNSNILRPVICEK